MSNNIDHNKGHKNTFRCLEVLRLRQFGATEKRTQTRSGRDSRLLAGFHREDPFIKGIIVQYCEYLLLSDHVLPFHPSKKDEMATHDLIKATRSVVYILGVVN